MKNSHVANDFPTPERYAKGDVTSYRKIFKALVETVPEKLFEAGVIDSGQLYCCNRFYIAWSAHLRPMGVTAMRYDERVQGCYEDGMLDRITMADEFRYITRIMPDKQWQAVRLVACDNVPLGQLSNKLNMRYYSAKDVFEQGLVWLAKHYEGLK